MTVHVVLTCVSASSGEYACHQRDTYVDLGGMSRLESHHTWSNEYTPLQLNYPQVREFTVPTEGCVYPRGRVARRALLLYFQKNPDSN